MAYGTSSASRRSYVAFAPDKTNDGLLTLGELMDDATLVLHTELVVLSACQTGLGDFKQAEGTIGLQRAFLAKGAHRTEKWGFSASAFAYQTFIAPSIEAADKLD